ncbi:DUF354 domain-containing protein [Halosimplex marinum]|uniref:DUF354 domain-containing protein n=1 Tax=Halosimplex marinum TaxID=3396620 RepID=UPI003F567D54
MKVFVTIQHPAHVHFFRNAIAELEAEGHAVSVFVRDVAVAPELLDAYGIDYEVLAPASDSLPSLARSQLQYELALLRRAWREDPDVLTAISEPAITHVSTLLDCRSVLFCDTEHATLENGLAFPFADRVCTPECYTDEIGDKQVRYPGYHELAYLHPDRFDPDPSVLDDVGVDRDERLVVLRLVAWDAVHDVGGAGFGDAREVVAELERHGATVRITAEADLPPELADRDATVAPERMHDLLYYADLFVGESATMASESAVLGTPAVFASSLTLGYLDELEAEYGLVFTTGGDNPQAEALERASAILAGYDETDWAERRERVLAERVDTTEVILSQVGDAAGRAGDADRGVAHPLAERQ